MEKEIYRSQFRLPQELFEKLKEAADRNKRSINAELVSRLEQSFSGYEGQIEHERKRAELRLMVAEEVERFLNPEAVEILNVTLSKEASD